MLQFTDFPLTEDAIGRGVNIVGGLLNGRAGKIDSLPDYPQSRLVMVELDRDGGNVWIDVDDLEETPLPVTTATPKGCPYCLRPTIELDSAAYVEEGEWNGNRYEAEGEARKYRCTSEDCGHTFLVW